MKSLKSSPGATLFVILLLFAAGADARCIRWFGPGGWEAGSEYNRLFDSKAALTVSGQVLTAQTFTPWKVMANGVSLAVKTATETVQVHLGPQWFLDHQELRIAPNDWVEVTGARVLFRGKPVIFASSIARGGQSLVLRDTEGRPVWSATRKR